MKNTILKEQILRREKRARLYSKASLKTHTKTIKAMFFVLAYFGLFIIIVLLQLQLSQRYNQTSLQESLEYQSIDFNPPSDSSRRRYLINYKSFKMK